MLEEYVGLLICQGTTFVPFYWSCSKSPKIDCSVANKAIWIQKEQEQKKTSPGKDIRNKRHGWVLKLRIVPANQHITKYMPEKEGENMRCSNCYVSMRDLSPESLKCQCYLSARSTGIFKQHDPLARSLQLKTQREERPNRIQRPIWFCLS